MARPYARHRARGSLLDHLSRDECPATHVGQRCVVGREWRCPRSGAWRLASTTSGGLLQLDVRGRARPLRCIPDGWAWRREVPMNSRFGLPLLLDGDWVSALVVGGGHLALRKANGLLQGGASVRVLARELHPQLVELAARSPRLTLQRGDYSSSAIADAILVVAATNDAQVNSTIAADARARGRLVMVADAPDAGNCVTPAVPRVGS